MRIAGSRGRNESSTALARGSTRRRRQVRAGNDGCAYAPDRSRGGGSAARGALRDGGGQRAACSPRRCPWTGESRSGPGRRSGTSAAARPAVRSWEVAGVAARGSRATARNRRFALSRQAQNDVWRGSWQEPWRVRQGRRRCRSSAPGDGCRSERRLMRGASPTREVAVVDDTLGGATPPAFGRRHGASAIGRVALVDGVIGA